MKTMKMGLILILFMLSLPFSPTAFAASEEELATLRMYYKEEDIAVVSATRFPKLKSQTAENITVITAKEIEEMNAHTLKDVLFNIPGIQVDFDTGVGSADFAYIQGSNYNHVLTVIDGVSLNNLSDNVSEIGAIPVQNIERIEIIKGPASSSWGSSLGGVINIITKSGSLRNFGGTVSASQGEMNTGDYRLESSGRKDNLGYYVYGGSLKSNGYSRGYGYYGNNLYTKLGYDATEKLNLVFTAGYNLANRGMGEFPDFDEIDKDRYEFLFSTFSLNYSITDNAEIKASLRGSWLNETILANLLSTGEPLSVKTLNEKNYGGSINLSLREGVHIIVLGSEFDGGTSKATFYNNETLERRKYGAYANDTISAGRFSITPGIRFDHVTTTGEIFSPSLGITYKLTERTLLRVFSSRGFNTPGIGATSGNTLRYHANPNLKYERIWSISGGIETTEVKYLWIKAVAFSHRIKDAMDVQYFEDGTWTLVNKKRQKREGFEIEAKTVPVYNTSLTAGAVYVNARDMDTGEKVIGTPDSTYDIGVEYNDRKSVTALLKGHYIWWNGDSSNNGRYGSFIWDINLTKKIYSTDKKEFEVFFTGHNIFNGAQYSTAYYKNPERWFEGGVRCKF